MVVVQIRHVPEEVHRRLKARAAEQGKSLSDYLRGELEEIAGVPTRQEMLDRLARLPPVPYGESTADIIGEEREMRERRVAGDRR